MQNISDKLVVALDVENLAKAKKLVDALFPVVKIFKVGSQLFTACGLDAVKMVGEKGAKVFLDLKFHDIPQTVFSAVTSGTGAACALAFVSNTSPNIEKNIKEVIQHPVFMMTVHAEGSIRMLEAAVRGATEKAQELHIKKPLIVGVTVLTSENDSGNVKEVVMERARKAKEAGLDGVVCAVAEAALVRKEFGNDFIIVTPGIRPIGATADDQQRTATPQEAIAAGANFIVVGRPILEAKDPLEAVKNLLQA